MEPRKQSYIADELAKHARTSSLSKHHITCESVVTGIIRFNNDIDSSALPVHQCFLQIARDKSFLQIGTRTDVGTGVAASAVQKFRRIVFLDKRTRTISIS